MHKNISYDIIPSLTVKKARNCYTPCCIRVIAVPFHFTEYGNLFSAFTFFLDCFHLAFRNELIICSKSTGCMKVICDFFTFI